MLQWEHSATLSTFIKLQVIIRPLFCLFLSGRLTQILLLNKHGLDGTKQKSTGYVTINHHYWKFE